ncbi:MAG: AraC family transcriptional regulator [Lachnospiraceae bacterium]|nr:AraC family transcriptional regulator [Lachnospiraceae bacterium]
MVDVKTNNDNSEIIPYDEAGIPIYIREGYLSFYPNYRALCHWHEDIEFIYILDGSMSYYINGENVLLKKGDSIVINSGRLHYGYSDLKKECHFYCIILHPSLITTNKILIKKYISAITQNSNKDYILFPDDKTMSELLVSIYNLKINPSPSYELEVIGLFHVLWKTIYNSMIAESDIYNANPTTELTYQQAMVSYIYQNYSNNITLNDIASAGNICRSKCCQIFKKYVGQSPMDFVNSYRLEVSQNLLLTTTLNITDICTTCGFNHLSYFTKQFQIKYGCTPRDYRKKIICINPHLHSSVKVKPKGGAHLSQI